MRPVRAIKSAVMRRVDLYLKGPSQKGAGQILCLATHSKLGLTHFVEQLDARAKTANHRHLPEIIDGGIIGLPVLDYLPQSISLDVPPRTIILLAHPQDPPRLLEKYGNALQGVLQGAHCFFHVVGDDLDTDIAN